MVFSRRVCWPATAIRDSADILCLLVWTDDSCSRKSRFSVVLRRVLSGILSQNRLSDGKRASAEPAADIAGGCGDAGGCGIVVSLCRRSAQFCRHAATQAPQPPAPPPPAPVRRDAVRTTTAVRTPSAQPAYRDLQPNRLAGSEITSF